MSKCSSNLFTRTTGLQLSSKNTETKHDIIFVRTEKMDLREHPSYQLSSKQLKEIKKKIDERTATYEEYKLYTHSIRLIKRRKKGVRDFWKQERERILSGQPTTRQWSANQMDDILHHRIPKFKGKSMQGHHTFSVLKYPHLANRGEVIYPVTPYEHLNGWHGGNYKDSVPGRPIKIINEF